MIFKFLPPSTLVSLFCMSKEILRYANLFCSLCPLYFYRCVDTPSPIPSSMMLALSSKLSRRLGYILNRRWELVSTIAYLAAHAANIGHTPARSYLDARAPRQVAPHRFGFQELFTEIPEALQLIEVHTRLLQGTSYVCGLGLNSETVCTFIGSRSGYLTKLMSHIL